MRASISIAASLTIGFAAACSNPASETAAGMDSTFESELELAIFPKEAQGGESQAVVSPLEIHDLAPGSSSAAVRQETSTAPVPDAEPTVSVVDQHSHPAPPVRQEPILQPVVLTGVRGDRPASVASPDKVTGVIIRGGIDRRDPCRIHRPGGAADVLGDIGVLINDPTPRNVGIGTRGVRPVNGGSPRGGVLFAGGIR